MPNYDRYLPMAKRLIDGLAGKPGVHFADRRIAADFLAQALTPNLKMHAAAPDLYEALQRLEFAARARENRAGDLCGLLESQAELAAAAEAARAALAKADGHK